MTSNPTQFLGRHNFKVNFSWFLPTFLFAFLLASLTGCTTMTNPLNQGGKSSQAGTINTAGSYDIFVEEFPDVQASQLVSFSKLDVFRIGDTADIAVFNVDSLTGSHIIDRAGEVSFPLIGKVTVAGLNTLELQAELVRRYGEKYLQDPSISVRLEAQKLGKIIVDGAVNKPGVFELYKTATLSESVALAGGLTVDANKKAIYLVREFATGRKVKIINLDEIRKAGAKDPKIYPNDIVYVQESGARIAFREILRTIPLINTMAILATR